MKNYQLTIKPCLLGFSIVGAFESAPGYLSAIDNYGVFEKFHDVLWFLLNIPDNVNVSLILN